MDFNKQDIQEVILNLLFSYTNKEHKPTPFELMSVEMALPYIEDEMESTTYRSYLEWIERHKVENSVDTMSY